MNCATAPCKHSAGKSRTRREALEEHSDGGRAAGVAADGGQLGRVGAALGDGKLFEHNCRSAQLA